MPVAAPSAAEHRGRPSSSFTAITIVSSISTPIPLEFVYHYDKKLDRELSAFIASALAYGRVEHFLREMGGLFAFVGSQYRLEIEGEEYFIDLLLFHRRLKCLVAVDLKIGKFQPEYVGKMQFYLAVLDDLAREEGENPSIGMILCKTKKRTVVEYALRE